MSANEMRESIPGLRKRWAQEWLIGLFLFGASATIIIWQNSRLGVLWDLSYILENAYRISLGDLPYRDFPFPFPPLTFVTQAAIIKLTGRVFWHTTAYCAVIGGLASVLTWRILLSLLRDVTRGRVIAWLLTLPLIPLGIYAVYPHPFYDPDCTFAILLSVLLLLRLERSNCSSVGALLAGASLVVPVFVKQNAGLAFALSAGLGLSILIVIEVSRRRSAKRYFFALAGSLAALVFALLAIQLTSGLSNYWYWTIKYAASRRTPPFEEMLGIYREKILLLWLGLFAIGAILWRLRRKGRRILALIAALIIASPFVWPAIYLLRDSDAYERAERLIGVWPLLLIATFVVSIVTLKRRKGISLVLPFVLIAAINGAFMSQQLWGSTYAIWPLFMILLATILAGLFCYRLDAGLVPQLDQAPNPLPKLPLSNLSNDSWALTLLVSLIALSLLISGWTYIRSHERLDYANLSEGELTHSSLPQLKGLSVRGEWLPNFDELVRYSEAQIPHDDGLLIVPGEDLFYYTTGRRPRFPVLLFDHTVNPNTPEETLKLCRERDIRWLVVKQDLQDEDDQLEADRDRLVEFLEKEYEQVDSLKNYDIYRRKDLSKSTEGDRDSEPETLK